MIKPQNTNSEFELGGINHVALVCSDMARTVDFYTNVLGMPLIKSLDLPGGAGQHFFFDAGNGDCVAFFWFADAPDRVPGLSSPAAIPGIGEITSAVSTMNHLAFHVPAEKFDEYRQRLKAKGVRVGQLVEQRRELVDQLIGIEPHCTGQPRADGLRHPTDHEMRGGLDPVVLWDAQCVLDMAAGEHSEQGTGFDTLADQHGIGQVCAEQQTTHTRVPADRPHDVGHAGAGLLLRRCSRHRGLRRGGQFGNHPVEDRGDELVLVGEALVEVAGGHPGPTADAANGQLRRVPLVGPQQIKACAQQPGPATGQAVCGVDATVGPCARRLGYGHEPHLDIGPRPAAISGNERSHN